MLLHENLKLKLVTVRGWILRSNVTSDLSELLLSFIKRSLCILYFIIVKSINTFCMSTRMSSLHLKVTDNQTSDSDHMVSY